VVDGFGDPQWTWNRKDFARQEGFPISGGRSTMTYVLKTRPSSETPEDRNRWRQAFCHRFGQPERNVLRWKIHDPGNEVEVKEGAPLAIGMTVICFGEGAKSRQFLSWTPSVLSGESKESEEL